MVTLAAPVDRCARSATRVPYVNKSITSYYQGLFLERYIKPTKEAGTFGSPLGEVNLLREIIDFGKKSLCKQNHFVTIN